MGFEKWDKELHYEPEQIKRILSSRKISDDNILDIDTENRTCVIAGKKGVYNVSLEECDCFDFHNRNIPCKHMYWLAGVLGELDKLSGLETEIDNYRIQVEQGEQLKLSYNEQINKIVKKEETNPDDVLKDDNNFGCCSKYKECSLEGHCIRDDIRSLNCTYRKKLENGEIYYSKSSKNFSQKSYDYIEKHYQSLSEAQRRAFVELIGLVIYINRCSVSAIVGKKGDNISDVYRCIENSKIFSTAEPIRIVRILFERNKLSCQNCQNFCNRYSDIPFYTKNIELPPELEFVFPEDYQKGTDSTNPKVKDLNYCGLKKHEKQIEFRLKKWEEFFLTSGTSAVNKFADNFAFIEFNQDYTVTTEEWAEDHKDIIPQKLEDFKYIVIETTDKDGRKIESFKKMDCFQRT